MTAEPRTETVATRWVPSRADISETCGAPSPTAVVRTNALPGPEGCAALLRRVYPALAAGGVPFSKVILIAPTTHAGDYDCRFLQLFGSTSETYSSVVTRRDCLNSMVAACHVAARLEVSGEGGEATEVALRNADTGLVLSADVADCFRDSFTVVARPLTALLPADAVVASGSGAPIWMGMQVNNPYLLIDAGAVGLSRAELLQEVGKPSATLLQSIDAPTMELRRHLGLAPDSDLPKVAFLLSADDHLVARTIYMDSWHPGLPLTGAISFSVAALVPGSPWYETGTMHTPLNIHSGREIVQVGPTIDPTSGFVTAFTIPNRRVVSYASGIRI